MIALVLQSSFGLAWQNLWRLLSPPFHTTPLTDTDRRAEVAVCDAPAVALAATPITIAVRVRATHATLAGAGPCPVLLHLHWNTLVTTMPLPGPVYARETVVFRVITTTPALPGYDHLRASLTQAGRPFHNHGDEAACGIDVISSPLVPGLLS